MVKKIENRNIDVTKARGELEEDLLEYVYRTLVDTSSASNTIITNYVSHFFKI